MAKGLKIYACSGIGNKPNEELMYWSDNTNTITNTQAINTLLSLINLRWAEYRHLRLDNAQKLQNLNDIDIYTVCLNAAYRYKDDPVELHKAGETIGKMLKDGLFEYNSTDAKKRDKHLDELLEIVNGYESNTAADGDFMKWYFDTIEIRNKQGLTKSEQKRGLEALEANGGVGAGDWQSDKDISEYLLNASDYFLYTFYTKEQLEQLPYVCTTKKREQVRTYNLMNHVFTELYGSKDEMDSIIRSGIISKYDMEPEDVCKAIVDGIITVDNESIGFDPVTVSAGVQAAIGILIALGIAAYGIAQILAPIINFCTRVKEAEWESANAETIAAACGDKMDYEDTELYQKYLTNKQNTGLWAAIAAGFIGLLLLLKK